MSEFPRPIDVRHIIEGPQHLTANPAECAALAARFGLVAVNRLEANVSLERNGTEVAVRGRLSAEIVQSCAVSGEDLAVTIAEPVLLRFVPQGSHPATDAEIELRPEELDEVTYDGTQFDLGEAIAQEMALAIDPYAEGPGAEEARRRSGLLDEGRGGPFAMLAALKKP